MHDNDRALNVLHEQHPSLFGPRIVFYSHNMRAFMGLRLSKRRDEFIVGRGLPGGFSNHR